MEQSEQIADLAAALAKAQGELEGAAKDKTNPAFRSKYADLGAVWEAWQEVGPKHGLALAQFPGQMAEGKATLTSMLMHSSGQWLRDTLTIPVSKQDAQGFGSALTYARRYALSAIVGVCPVDDDGNAAVGNGHSRGNNAPAQQRQERPRPQPVEAPKAQAEPESPAAILGEMEDIATQFPGMSESLHMLVQQLRQCQTTQAYKSWEDKNLGVISKLDTPEVNALRAECGAQKERIRKINQLAA